jgi:hypothetical protein
MKKIGKYLVNCIRSISGIFLLMIVILFWIIGFILKAVIEIVTWLELKLTELMKKTFGDEVNKLN